MGIKLNLTGSCLISGYARIAATPVENLIATANSLKPSTLTVLSASVTVKSMERVMGIEPTLSAWEAEVLPLNYTRLGDQVHFS